MPLSTDGLSDALYNKIEDAFGKIPRAGRKPLRKFTDALAGAFVTYFQANATITVTVDTTTTITTGDAGLQRSPEPPNTATLAPAGNKTLSGTGTGTGTLT